MGRTSDAREKLLQVAFDLIWESSYGSVSVDDICERAGVKKGSFYHFFPSKCDLAVAAIDTWAEQMRPEMDRMFSALVPPLERIQGFFDFMYRSQLQTHRERGRVLGCPFASLGCEMSTLEEKLRAKTAEITDKMLTYFEGAIADAQRAGLIGEGDPKLLAKQVHSFKTGLMTEAKIHNDPSRLAGCGETVLRILGARRPESDVAA